MCKRNKLVSSEVTNRDDYHSEELSSEKDISEEIIVEDNCSEHSNRDVRNVGSKDSSLEDYFSQDKGQRTPF